MKQLVETDRFIARSDDGEEVEIIEYTEMEMATPDKEVAGLKNYQTSEGKLVNEKDNGTYEIPGENYFDLEKIFHRVKA